MDTGADRQPTAEEMIAIRKTWAGGASHLVGECYDAACPLIDKDSDKLHPYLRFVSSQLFIDCSLTSESVCLLVREGKDWDADLVGRSVLEGTLKYVYMLTGSESEMLEKAKEYWDLLPDFDTVRTSERMIRLLNEVDDPDAIRWKPFRDLVLSQDQIEQNRHGTNRQQRKMMSERWSLAGISKQFTQGSDEGLKPFVHMMHNYGMSSHLLHKDGTGVGIVWDRYQRDPVRQIAVSLAHASRIVSDVCALAKLRLIYLLRACDEPNACVKEINERYQWLERELQKANQQFNRVEYSD